MTPCIFPVMLSAISKLEIPSRHGGDFWVKAVLTNATRKDILEGQQAPVLMITLVIPQCIMGFPFVAI